MAQPPAKMEKGGDASPSEVEWFPAESEGGGQGDRTLSSSLRSGRQLFLDSSSRNFTRFLTLRISSNHSTSGTTLWRYPSQDEGAGNDRFCQCPGRCTLRITCAPCSLCGFAVLSSVSSNSSLTETRCSTCCHSGRVSMPSKTSVFWAVSRSKWYWPAPRTRTQVFS